MPMDLRAQKVWFTILSTFWFLFLEGVGWEFSEAVATSLPGSLLDHSYSNISLHLGLIGNSDERGFHFQMAV